MFTNNDCERNRCLYEKRLVRRASFHWRLLTWLPSYRYFNGLPISGVTFAIRNLLFYNDFCLFILFLIQCKAEVYLKSLFIMILKSIEKKIIQYFLFYEFLHIFHIIAKKKKSVNEKTIFSLKRILNILTSNRKQ